MLITFRCLENRGSVDQIHVLFVDVVITVSFWIWNLKHLLIVVGTCHGYAAFKKGHKLQNDDYCCVIIKSQLIGKSRSSRLRTVGLCFCGFNDVLASESEIWSTCFCFRDWPWICWVLKGAQIMDWYDSYCCVITKLQLIANLQYI